MTVARHTLGPIESAALSGAPGPELHQVIDYQAAASFGLAAANIVHSGLLDSLEPTILQHFPRAAKAWHDRGMLASYAADARDLLSDLPSAEPLIVTIRDAAFQDTELAARDLKAHMHAAQRAIPIARTAIRHTPPDGNPFAPSAKDVLLGVAAPFVRAGHVGADKLAAKVNGHRPEVRKGFEQAYDRGVLPLAVQLDKFFRDNPEFPNLQAELVGEARVLADAVWGEAEKIAGSKTVTSRDIGYALYRTLQNLHEYPNWQEWGRTHIPLLTKLGLGKTEIKEFTTLPNPQAPTTALRRITPKGLTQFALAKSGTMHRESTEEDKVDVATAEILGVGAYEIMYAFEELGTQPGQIISPETRARLDILSRNAHPLRPLLEHLPNIGKLRKIHDRLDGILSLPSFAKALRELAPKSQKQAQDTVAALARLVLPARKA